MTGDLLRKLAIPGLVALSLLSLYGWGLGTIPAGMSRAEVSARQNSSSVNKILENPIYAPHKAVQYTLQKTGYHVVLASRLASVIWGLIILFCIYIVLKLWFGNLISSLGIILLASWPWFILLARSATPEIILMMPVVIVAVFLWLQTTTRHQLGAAIVLSLVVGISLYVPGMLWLLIAGLILYGHRARRLIAKAGKVALVSSFGVIILLLVPLVVATVRDWTIIKSLLLIPEQLPLGIEFLKSTAWSALGVVWQTRDHLPLILGRLPILNATGVILMVIGGFWLLGELRRRRSYLLLVWLGVSVLLAGFNNNLVYISLGLPALGLIIVGGLHYLYREWSAIFPHNPFARVLATGLIIMLVGINFIFGLRYSLLAWPHSPETKSTYVLK